MSYRVIIALWSLVASLNSFSQTTETDSLESLVRSVPSDTTKVWLLNTLVSKLREKNNLKALAFAQEAKNLSELLAYKRGYGNALENLGWLLYRKGDYSNSFNYSRQALKIMEELQDRPGIAKCLINIAAITFEQKQYGSAIDNFKKAYRISEAIGDVKTMARSLNNISYTLVQLKEYDSALLYAERALETSEKLNERYMIGFSQRTIGDVYLARNEFQKALNYFAPTLELAEEEKNIFLKASTYNRLGKVYRALGQLDKALACLHQNISLAKQYDYKDELERSYKLIGEIYFQNGNAAKAYEFQQHYIALHDSLYNQRNIEQMALMQGKFEAEIKQAQIELLTKEAELKGEEINSQQVWLYFYLGCLTLMILLAFVFYYHYRNNRKAKLILQEKNKEIYKQTHQLRNLNSAKDKLFSIISHDLRSPVASLRALLELINTSGLTQKEFVDITKALKNNLDSVYSDLDNLLLWAQTQLKGLQAVPEPIVLRDLVNDKVALFNEAARTKKITISNEIHTDAMVFADRNHMNLVFRNLLTNAIKFNQNNGTIILSSRELDDHYEISVKDSGVGIGLDDLSKLFNAETHFTKPGTNREKGVGIGLLLTKEFIETNNGTISVQSELGKGTTFTFLLKAWKSEVLV
jgi:two-component system, sensor histidine kinase and response regulator